MREAFAGVATHLRLFTTDAEGLNALYLDSLPAERQAHNCHACRQFLERYGGLVAITKVGDAIPVMWRPEAVPAFYAPAFAALHERVRRARVTGVFLTKQSVWGQPITGAWSHMAVHAPAQLIYHERMLTAGQAMAATRENYRTVAAALAEFTALMLDQALRLLNADTLARSERFIGPARWLRALHDRPKGRAGENVLWRAVALAPEGYCHPKASVLAPLLADIAAGLPFEDIKTRFDAMLHPLRYQRPQAAPSAGNIAAAEALVAKLGIAPSLERRFARLDELFTIWKPARAPKPQVAGGVFSHIRSKDAPGTVPPVQLPRIMMTWVKFAGTVLPSAERIEMRVPVHGNFTAMLTAANADAPPILKWDRPDARNPVSFYVYSRGSMAAQWGLQELAWCEVNAIAPVPHLWGDRPSAFFGDNQILVLDGAVDSRTGQGNGIFPETLRDELHGARATIEAYSQLAVIAGREEASACGYAIGKNHANIELRVWTGGASAVYYIDRWD